MVGIARRIMNAVGHARRIDERIARVVREIEPPDATVSRGHQRSRPVLQECHVVERRNVRGELFESRSKLRRSIDGSNRFGSRAIDGDRAGDLDLWPRRSSHPPDAGENRQHEEDDEPPHCAAALCSRGLVFT